MIPGMTGAMAMQGGVDYDAAIAAITSKTIYARADTSGAVNNATLNTTAWDNEASVTDITGANVQWKTGLLNGFRGVETGATVNGAAEAGFNLATLLAGSLTFTGFAVEKRSGLQGGSTGTGRYSNGFVLGGNDYWSLCFEGRTFYQYTYPGSYAFSQSPFSFTDDAPYVIGWRIDGSGSVRFNLNGTAAAGMGTVGFPSSLAHAVRLTRRQAISSSSNLIQGFEYIASSEALSDTVMDDAVAALMQKWGIS